MTYTVTAGRSRPGWELRITEGGRHVGVTQATHLRYAEKAARDYVVLLTGRDVSGDKFIVIEDPQAERKSRQRDAEPEAGG